MRFLPLLLTLLATASAWANPLPNPGFESEITHWELRDTMSKATAEAAREGKLGLRVEDRDAVAGSSLMSSQLPVQPGQDVTASFWARSHDEGKFCGVYFWFRDAKNKVIQDNSLMNAVVEPTQGQWREYQMSAKVPAGAATVSLWIHSFSTAQGKVDFDDFTLGGIAAGAQPILAKPAPPEPVMPTVIPKRDKPALIVIKVDDLRMVNGKVPLLWTRVVDVIESRGIKGSIGIICQTLEQATPEYAGWIKEQQASGRIEFWFHGYTHDVRTIDGNAVAEFHQRDYAEQRRRFDVSQKLAKEKLGFAFHTFGPPGGGVPSFDEVTIQVMGDEPDMNIWLYPTPLDAPGRKLQEAGKVLILDRVFEVNIERAVGVPDFTRFVIGYAKNPDREYFVIQGHPAQWTQPGKFEEFVKIVDFLVEQKARFVTPMELAAELRARK